MNNVFFIIQLFLCQIVLSSCNGNGENYTIKTISSTFMNEEVCIMSDEDYIKQFKELDELKIDTIILNNIIISTSEGNFRYICNYSKSEAINLILKLQRLSKENNKFLYLGLVNGMFVRTDYYNEYNSTFIYNKTIELLEDLKLNNITDIEGFYIPDEPALGCQDLHDQIILHYNRISNKIREYYPNKKIIASPYFCYKRKEPKEIGSNVKHFIEKTNIDILAFQDGVGAYSDLKNIDLVAEYFKEISNNISQERLWVLIELFEDMCSYTCNNMNYNATNINRLKEQINKLTKYGSKTTCQAQTHHLSEVISTSIKYGGDKLKKDYIGEVLITNK